LLSSPTFGDSGSGDVVKVSGSPYVIFDGFQIEGGGAYCISFTQNSTAPTLRNMVFSYCRYGAQLPAASIVEWSEYVWPGFHNFYLYNYDDHIQMESTAGFPSRELRLHDNLFLAAGNSSVSHQEPGLIGPHYVYRNVMYGYDDHGWGAWTIIKSDSPNATQKI